jgi:hypothetical protein
LFPVLLIPSSPGICLNSRRSAPLALYFTFIRIDPGSDFCQVIKDEELASSVDLSVSHTTSPGKLEEVLVQCHHCVLAFLGAFAHGGRDRVLPSWEAQSHYWFHIQANSSGYQLHAFCVNQVRFSSASFHPLIVSNVRPNTAHDGSFNSRRIVFEILQQILFLEIWFSCAILPRASVTRVIDTSF